MTSRKRSKRGNNYTSFEKRHFLSIVQMFTDIIENKDLKASSIEKKRQAWEHVTTVYNATAVSGSRTPDQLRHLYENIKQRNKKNAALSNEQQSFELDYNCTLNDENNKSFPGGGLNGAIHAATNRHFSAMMDPLVTAPSSNECNRSASRFGDVPNSIGEDEDNSNEDTIPVEVDIREISEDELSRNDTNKKKINDVEVDIVRLDGSRLQHSTKFGGSSRYTGNEALRAQSFKEAYFEMKYENARLERKYMINTYKMKFQQHNLEMKTLKLKYNSLLRMHKRNIRK